MQRLIFPKPAWRRGYWKASRRQFSQPGSKNKIAESRVAILGRPKIDRVLPISSTPGSRLGKIKNKKGQVAVFFILVIPILILMLVTTVRFSRLVFKKIRLQTTTDRAAYAGASYLSEILNRMAFLDWKVHKLFLDRKEDFLKKGSKRNEKEVKDQIQKTIADQNILLSEMEELEGSAYENAYTIASQVFHKEFPGVDLVPLYQKPVVLREGPKESFNFDKINGVIFDPTGRQHISRKDFELRMAFVKDPAAVAGFAVRTAVPEYGHSLEAMSAAEPYGGSLWNFALSPDKSGEFLYRTAMVPVETFYAEESGR